MRASPCGSVRGDSDQRSVARPSASVPIPSGPPSKKRDRRTALGPTLELRRQVFRRQRLASFRERDDVRAGRDRASHARALVGEGSVGRRGGGAARERQHLELERTTAADAVRIFGVARIDPARLAVRCGDQLEAQHRRRLEALKRARRRQLDRARTTSRAFRGYRTRGRAAASRAPRRRRDRREPTRLPSRLRRQSGGGPAASTFG